MHKLLSYLPTAGMALLIWATFFLFPWAKFMSDTAAGTCLLLLLPVAIYGSIHNRRERAKRAEIRRSLAA